MSGRLRRSERMAQTLLREHWDGVLPVAPEELARAAGVTVLYRPLEAGTSGMLVCQPSQRPVAVINQAHHPVRQRFSVAHELGHYQLHQHLEVRVSRFYRDARSAAGVDRTEIEANQFAAELLMPRQEVRRVASYMPAFALEDEGVAEIAAHFNVSATAMSFRLLNLGFVLV
jgi:Zn-dependent peptidase ImmA (M78 family)